MQVTMQHAEHLTLAEMREFLDASNTLSFAGTGRKQIYALLERVLRTQKYLGLAKKDKGIVRRYLVKISGLSKAQITRLIARWRERGVIEPRASRRHRFPHRYTPADIQLLAETDAAHEGLSAPAVRRILEREFKVHRQAQYERRASISASHIYNLRRTRAYREHHVHHTKTRASAVSIGERRKPDPRGQPGFVRVDTVHQGESPKGKGSLSHQCCRHSDAMAGRGLLRNHLRGPFIASFRGDTASIPLPYPGLSFRQRLGVSQLQGAETVEQIIGPGVHQVAGQSYHRQRFGGRQKRRGGTQAHRTRTDRGPSCRRGAALLHGRFQPLFELSPLNYHRPCGFATIELSDNGKRRRRYRLNDYRTPYEKLLSLNDWESYLKEGVSAARLEQQALRMSDTECALRMQQRKRKLLDACRVRR